VLFLALGVLGLVALHLSTEVGHLEEEVRTSVEETALLRCELEDTKRELDKRIAALEAQGKPATNGHQKILSN
jgi:regulator of replication initiation timing